MYIYIGICTHAWAYTCITSIASTTYSTVSIGMYRYKFKLVADLFGSPLTKL